MNDSSHDERRARLRGALVRAGREERISPALRASLLALAAAAPAAPIAAAATADVAAKSAATAKTAFAAKAATASWKLYAALAFVAGTGAGIGASLPSLATSTSSSPPPAIAVPAARAPRAHVSSPSSASPAPEVPSMNSNSALPTVDVGDLPSAPSSSVSHTRVRAAAPPSAPASVAEEMALVDRIRSAAAAGNDGEALRLLDEHHARFPAGMLVEEAEVMRIESHARLSRPDTAAQLARRFLEAHPASPYAPRVRTTLSRLPVSVQEQP